MIGLIIDCLRWLTNQPLPVLCCCDPDNFRGYRTRPYYQGAVQYKTRLWRSGWRLGLAYTLESEFSIAWLAVDTPTEDQIATFARRRGKKKPRWVGGKKGK